MNVTEKSLVSSRVPGVISLWDGMRGAMRPGRRRSKEWR
jgi:hypothetical protein